LTTVAILSWVITSVLFGEHGQNAPETGDEAGALMAIRMRVEIRHPASELEVRLRHELEIEPGTREIPLRGVAFFGTELTEVAAISDGSTLPVHMDDSGTSLLSGNLVLPNTLLARRRVTLDLTYGVSNANRGSSEEGFDLTVPLLLVDWRPVAATDTFFTARILLSADHHIAEFFPTIPTTSKEVDGVREHTIVVPAVPGLLRLRGGEGSHPFLTFNHMLDLGVLLVIGLLSVAGWRRLRAQ
jgi:hypothetical protein